MITSAAAPLCDCVLYSPLVLLYRKYPLYFRVMQKSHNYILCLQTVDSENKMMNQYYREHAVEIHSL